MADPVPGSAASSPVTEPCPHCGCPVADGEWFEDDEGTASCTCCALRDECDPNDPDCTCRREDALVGAAPPISEYALRVKHAVEQIDHALTDSRIDGAAAAWLRTIRSGLIGSEDGT